MGVDRAAFRLMCSAMISTGAIIPLKFALAVLHMLKQVAAFRCDGKTCIEIFHYASTKHGGNHDAGIGANIFFNRLLACVTL